MGDGLPVSDGRSLHLGGRYHHSGGGSRIKGAPTETQWNPAEFNHWYQYSNIYSKSATRKQSIQQHYTVEWKVGNNKLNCRHKKRNCKLATCIQAINIKYANLILMHTNDFQKALLLWSRNINVFVDKSGWLLQLTWPTSLFSLAWQSQKLRQERLNL